MIKIINVYKDSRVMEMTSSSNLGLGVRTDNDVDLLRFTFDEMIVGTATLLTSLKDDNGDLVAFPLTINEEEKSYDLEVTKYVASQTNYTIQVEIVNDDMIWHSKQADIILDECLEVGEGEMPTTIDNWLQNANLVMSGYQDKIDEWESEIEQAVTGAENVNIEVEEGENLYNVTITDREGVEHEAVIYQGANAIISGATASVDNQVGTPSVNVTMGGTESDRTFDFAFHNLKGEQGDKGDKGDPGAIKFEIVDQLPTTDIEEDTIYLVPITPDTEDNNYEEYIYVNGEWELLGRIGVHVDLSDYYTKSETNSLLNNKVDTTTFNTSQQAQDTLIANKVNTTTYNQGQATQDTKITNLENQVFGDETIESEGTSLTLDGTLKGQFNSINLKGNTSQDGTPTPSSPIPINVVSGDNEIVVNGKNLFDKNNYIMESGYADHEITETGIKVYSNITSSTISNLFSLFKIGTAKQFNGKDLIVSANINNFTNKWGWYLGYADEDGNNRVIISQTRTSSSTGAKTLKMTVDGTAYANKIVVLVLFGVDGYAPTTGNYAQFDDLQVEYGTTATTYEPYQGNTYNIDLPEGMELCKIGNYQDYFYKDSDKWYLHKEIGKVVLNGSEDWVIFNSSSSRVTFRTIINGIEGYTNGNTIPNITSNRFIPNSYNATWVIGNVSRTTASGGQNFVLFVYEPNTTVEQFKAWLSSNNIIAYYVLETPTDTEITYQPLIDQLNGLEKAQSKENQTNISQVNNDLPFIISASAFLNNINGKIALLNKLTEV